ncbi:MAG TPA: hypothetical protein PK619_01835 [bacterium]|nr:hypothetical protein [bacterium]HPW39439.1 hypothetical protein [bacterium]HQA63623.1 hypothetical protein [bacterium]
MILKILYKQKKDIDNYRIIANTEFKGGPSKVLELFNKKFDALTDENLSKFIDGFINYNKINLEETLENFKNSWKPVEERFINRMNGIFDYDFSLKKVTVYLTTNDRCSYCLDQWYFFLTVLSKRPKLIIMHELFHFYTHLIFKDGLAKLDRKQAYDIKESLVEILNLEFSDLMGGEDKGYNQHHELRKQVKKYWQEKKDVRYVFDKLTDKLIKAA